MRKYWTYTHKPPEQSPQVHPIWRGIGCLMVIILPVMSFLGARELVNFGISQSWPIPAELYGNVQFPEWVWNMPFLASLAAPIASFPHMYAVLVFFIVLLILLSGLYSTIYAIMHRVTGPSRYSPLDAPPPKHRGKVYKR